MLGQQFGSYTVTAKLGEGGMGVVYLAEHSVMKRKAAVKVLREEMTRNEEIARRFINEATAAASIQHPGIVDVMDVGTHESGCLFILMEFLDGEGLAERIRRLGVLPPEHAISIARQAAGALDAAHRAGIVHRDLKPDNLFVVPVPDVTGGERVKVLDFGIAKLSGDGMASLVTRTGAMMGTPVYMSPEQCRGAGAVDQRSDLYSMGCILFEMLAGRPPFVGEGIGDLISSHMKEPPPTLRSVNGALPASIEPVVARLLQKRADDRYQSCGELIAALDAVVLGDSATPAIAAPAIAAAPIAPTQPSTPAAFAAPDTTLGGTAAEVRRPITDEMTAVTSTRRWIVPAAAIGFAAIAGIVIVVAMNGDAPVPTPAAANEQVAPQGEDASVAAAPEVGALLTAARTARDDERWTDMQTAAAAALAVSPDDTDALALQRQAQREVENELVYTAFTAAVSKDDYAQVAELFAQLESDSVYRSKAQPEHDRLRGEYAAQVSKAKKCKDLKKLARDVPDTWSEERAAVAQLEQKACKAAAVTPTGGCRRSCKSDEKTDARGCCVPGKSAEELSTEAANQAKVGNYGRALKLCEDALHISPGHGRARMVCALSACMVKSETKAKRHYRLLSVGAKRLARSQCAKAGIELD